MVKRVVVLTLILSSSLLLCACQPTVTIQTQAGGIGHRADKLKQYMGGEADSSIEIKNNVIYMGKEYENNTFGPGKVKFVFDK